MEQYKDMEIFSKTTKSYEIFFKKNGQVIDITEWVVYFTVKENMNDEDNNAVISKDIGYGQSIAHSDPTNGKTLITLSAEDTDRKGNYYYDIKYKDNENNVGILFSGRIRFIKPVTTRG